MSEIKKLKILAYSDDTQVSTGFGGVSKQILTALNNTGLYEIEHLAVNHTGNFNDTPWKVLPARLQNPEDVYGKGTFLRLLVERDYDFVWILNDSFVVSDIVPEMEKILASRKQMNRSIPIIIFYYPVDCHIKSDMTGMIKACDIPVAYNEYGLNETLKTLPELAGKIQVIPHGVDTKIYQPFDAVSVRLLKQKYYKDRADHFIILNVNRNSERKQLTQTILAFSKFKKLVPKSLLMLHTVPIDMSFGSKAIDLFAVIQDVGLTLGDVLIPKHYKLTQGYPDYILNEVYNAADVFVSNHLGEGFGLSIVEAMAAGIPVVTGRNTCMPEFFGNNSERGYMYPCKDMLWIDSSGFRPRGNTDDIVNELYKVYQAGDKFSNPKVIASRRWTEQHTWDQACKMWVELFAKAKKKNVEKQPVVSALTGMILGETI